eukprot:524437-Rhodomonas_salina.4
MCRNNVHTNVRCAALGIVLGFLQAFYILARMRLRWHPAIQVRPPYAASRPCPAMLLPDGCSSTVAIQLRRSIFRVASSGTATRWPVLNCRLLCDIRY